MNNFDDIYNQAVRVSHDLVEDIRFSRVIDLEATKHCSELICNYLNNNSNILTILNSVQDKNQYMFSHPVNVAFLSYFIGKCVGVGNKELYDLTYTGLLHDIGKAKIRDSILNKPEKLSDVEMDIIRTHPVLGYKILASIGVLDSEVLLGVLFHHERQDGSGYPKGLKGGQISLFGRIIAVADIYDAVTSTKVYREKRSPFKAIEEIQESSFDTLDPKICHIFMNHIADYYYGSQVRLSNKQIGEIIYVNPGEKTKPLIRCDNEYFNLAKERELEIVEMLT